MTLHYRDIDGDGGSNVGQQMDQRRARLGQRLAKIQHTIAITSGKGGVGKSTVTVNLAASLAGLGYRVGILDGDIQGSTVAKMMGLVGYRPEWRHDGVEPGVTPAGIKVMGIDFLLPLDQPVKWQGPQSEQYAWRGILEAQALREFLTDTKWGELDVLLLDLPPGTNQMDTLIDLVPNLSAAIVVSIPSEISKYVVSRANRFLVEKIGSRLMGMVINMSSYFHAETGDLLPLYPESPDHSATILARISFDPRMALACDEGEPYANRFPTAAPAQAIRQLAIRAMDILKRSDDV